MTIAPDGSYVYTPAGQLYLKDAEGRWHEWVNGALVAVDDPTAGLSAEGSRIEAADKGAIVTLEGAFSFAADIDRAGNHGILLNGAAVGARAAELAIFGGNLYARPLSPAIPGGFYRWADGAFAGMP